MPDPHLMGMFRRHLRNPRYWGRIRGILHSYDYHALQDPYAVGTMIDQLCGCCGMGITPGQRAEAVQFVVAQRVDPRLWSHRARMWRTLHSY
ncbi:MAG: serine/threonine protein kinase [Bacilli bacterium]|nr:serine/threonine protein kinase [Bacilli bacterium]